MELSPQDVEHLGRLARLDLTGEEMARYAGQLSAVVGYVDQLSSVDTTSAPEHVSLTQTSNVLAADEPRPDGDLAKVAREQLLAGTPAVSGSLIEVRAVLSGEGGGA